MPRDLLDPNVRGYAHNMGLIQGGLNMLNQPYTKTPTSGIQGLGFGLQGYMQGSQAATAKKAALEKLVFDQKQKEAQRTFENRMQTDRLGLDRDRYNLDVDKFDASQVPIAPKPILQGATQDLITAEGKLLRAGSARGEKTAPDLSVLTRGLSPVVAQRALAAYNAIPGGGKDALKEFNTEKVRAIEDEKREAVTLSLTKLYPDATPDELTKLETVASLAPTSAEGLASAKSLRQSQKDAKAAQRVIDQGRALAQKITSIDNRDALNEVIGSWQGRGFNTSLFFDDESEMIADIEDLQAILTKDNLNLMKGVLSENDMKLLTRISGGGLNRTRGEKRFLQHAQGILQALGGPIDDDGSGGVSKKRVEDMTEEELEAAADPKRTR